MFGQDTLGHRGPADAGPGAGKCDPRGTYPVPDVGAHQRRVGEQAVRRVRLFGHGRQLQSVGQRGRGPVRAGQGQGAVRMLAGCGRVGADHGPALRHVRRCPGEAVGHRDRLRGRCLRAGVTDRAQDPGEATQGRSERGRDAPVLRHEGRLLVGGARLLEVSAQLVRLTQAGQRVREAGRTGPLECGAGGAEPVPRREEAPAAQIKIRPVVPGQTGDRRVHRRAGPVHEGQRGVELDPRAAEIALLQPLRGPVRPDPYLLGPVPGALSGVDRQRVVAVVARPVALHRGDQSGHRVGCGEGTRVRGGTGQPQCPFRGVAALRRSAAGPVDAGGPRHQQSDVGDVVLLAAVRPVQHRLRRRQLALQVQHHRAGPRRPGGERPGPGGDAERRLGGRFPIAGIREHQHCPCGGVAGGGDGLRHGAQHDHLAPPWLSGLTPQWRTAQQDQPLPTPPTSRPDSRWGVCRTR